MVTYLNIHTHLPEQRQNVKSLLSLSIGHDSLSELEAREVTLGIHPWFINPKTLQRDLIELEKLSTFSNVKMIGECGLDKLKGAPFQLQIETFQTQMELAKKVGKPMILHCVKAYDELLAMAKQIVPEVPMVVHGFNKNEQLGRQLIDHGFTLSFGKAILNEHAGSAALLANCENFLLETDDAELSIQEIYDAAAKIKKMTLDDLKGLIFANWKNLNLI